MENAVEMIEKIKNASDAKNDFCRHTKPDGHRCGSPALRGEKFCYYHHTTRKAIADPQQGQARRNRFLLPTPGSRAEIQDALGKVLTRIASNDIDPRRAGLLLYALQIACTNLTLTDSQKKQNQHDPKQQANQSPVPNPEIAPAPEHETTSDPSDTQDVVVLRRPVFKAILEGLARHRGDIPSADEPQPEEFTQSSPQVPKDTPIESTVLSTLNAEALESQNWFAPPTNAHNSTTVSFRTERSEVEQPPHFARRATDASGWLSACRKGISRLRSLAPQTKCGDSSTAAFRPPLGMTPRRQEWAQPAVSAHGYTVAKTEKGPTGR